MSIIVWVCAFMCKNLKFFTVKRSGWEWKTSLDSSRGNEICQKWFSIISFCMGKSKEICHKNEVNYSLSVTIGSNTQKNTNTSCSQYCKLSMCVSFGDDVLLLFSSLLLVLLLLLLFLFIYVLYRNQVKHISPTSKVLCIFPNLIRLIKYRNYFA